MALVNLQRVWSLEPCLLQGMRQILEIRSLSVLSKPGLESGPNYRYLSTDVGNLPGRDTTKSSSQAESSVASGSINSPTPGAVQSDLASNSASTGEVKPVRELIQPIYIGNLPWSISEVELRSILSKHGRVTWLQLFLDSYTGRHKGAAMARFDNNEASESAIQAINGLVLNGRVVRSSWARYKPPAYAQDHTNHGIHKRKK